VYWKNRRTDMKARKPEIKREGSKVGALGIIFFDVQDLPEDRSRVSLRARPAKEASGLKPSRLTKTIRIVILMKSYI
jgi:hypothetical protein